MTSEKRPQPHALVDPADRPRTSSSPKRVGALKVNTALPIAAALVSDVLSWHGVPGGSLLGELAQALVQRRLDDARDILLSKITKGQISLRKASDGDQLIGILFRYQQAAVAGAARENLQLLASIVAGLNARDRLSSSEFLMWADALANLRRAELILIAAMHRAERNCPSELSVRDKAMWATDGKWANVFRAVIPDPFPSEAAVKAAAASATRSGLIMPTSGSIDYPVSFITTPAVDELLELAALEPLFDRESDEQS